MKKSFSRDEMDNPFQSSRIRIMPKVTSEITIYIDDDIEEPSKYRDETQVLLNASPEDDITIVINSGGGRVDTALQLVEAMQYSPANITAVVTGDCMSAATLLALTAQQVIVLDSSSFMCHQAHYGYADGASRLKDFVSYNHTRLDKLIDKFYTGFLTKKEIDELKGGKEFWFDAEEARERFANRIKHLKAEYSKAKKEKDKQAKKVSSEKSDPVGEV